MQKAIEIGSKSFGIDPGAMGVAIEAVFSEKLKEAVRKLLEKLKLAFAQNDYKTYKPSGYVKKQSLLWLKPYGEPDEDSMLQEPRKLLWTVTYKIPSQRGKLMMAPASVPEKLIIVQDESGSTTAPFGATNVVSAETLVSMVVAAGLKYKKGAKEIDVIKFSSHYDHVYSGNSEVEACTKLFIPSSISGGGTEIIKAVKYALTKTKKNTALVVVTDAVIGDYEADKLGEMLKSAADRGKVGFVVFIVVNEEEVPAINIIRKHLQGRNCIVEHIRNPDDLIQVSNNIMTHILKVYSST